MVVQTKMKNENHNDLRRKEMRRE